MREVSLSGKVKRRMRGRALGQDVVIGQKDAVVARLGVFALLVVVRAVARDRAVLAARDLAQRTGRRHDEQVAQIAEPPHAAHLCEGKALDRGVLVAVAGAVVTAGDGVGADLHHAVGGRRPGEGLAQPVVDARSRGARAGADKGIHIVGRREGPGLRCGRAADGKGRQQGCGKGKDTA